MQYKEKMYKYELNLFLTCYYKKIFEKENTI